MSDFLSSQPGEPFEAPVYNANGSLPRGSALPTGTHTQILKVSMGFGEMEEMEV